MEEVNNMPKLSQLASGPGTMIGPGTMSGSNNPMSGINVYSPNDVRAREVRLH